MQLSRIDDPRHAPKRTRSRANQDVAFCVYRVLRSQSGADGPALLHELGGARLHPGRTTEDAKLASISAGIHGSMLGTGHFLIVGTRGIIAPTQRGNREGLTILQDATRSAPEFTGTAMEFDRSIHYATVASPAPQHRLVALCRGFSSPTASHHRARLVDSGGRASSTIVSRRYRC